MSVTAARYLSLSLFGLFSASMLAGIIYIGISRSFFGDPLVLRYSTQEMQSRRENASSALMAACVSAVLVAPILGGVLFAILILADADRSQALILAGSLALVSPLLVLQELVRTAGYSIGRPAAALANSSAWTGLLACGLAMGVLLDLRPAGWQLLLLWGCSAFGGLVVGCLALQIRPRRSRGRFWLESHIHLSSRLLSDFALTQVTAEGSLLLIVIVAGADDIGLLRLAQLPLAPITVVTGGVIAVAQPALVRRIARGARVVQVQRFAYSVGALIAFAAVILGLGILLVPNSIMQALIGSNWSNARQLVPTLVLYLGLGAVAACQGIALRALGRLGVQVRARLWLTPVVLALVCFSAMGGVKMAVFGLLMGLVLVVACWSYLLWRTEDSAAPAEGGSQ